jgi:hypothetical protein
MGDLQSEQQNKRRVPFCYSFLIYGTRQKVTRWRLRWEGKGSNTMLSESCCTSRERYTGVPSLKSSKFRYASDELPLIDTLQILVPLLVDRSAIKNTHLVNYVLPYKIDFQLNFTSEYFPTNVVVKWLPLMHRIP